MVSCSSTPATRATTGWKASSAVLASERGKPRRNEVGASMSTGRHLADSLALKIALVAVWLRCDPETDRRWRRERRCRIGPALSRRVEGPAIGRHFAVDRYQSLSMR